MIEANITRHETVTRDGETWTGPNAEGDCARALIGAGIDPAEPLQFARNGVVTLRGTVAAFAGRAWGGADADPQFRRWRPHPQGQYPDLLLQWHAQRPVGRHGGAGMPDASTEASGGPDGLRRNGAPRTTSPASSDPRLAAGTGGAAAAELQPLHERSWIAHAIAAVEGCPDH
jgi:hypothetical protein